VGLAVGDLRGDGHLDVVTANASGSSGSVLLSNGDGTFRPHIDFATGGTGSRSVALARLRPGGPLDVIVANSDNPGSSTVSVLLGVGNGTFRPAVQYRLGTDDNPVAVAVGDFTGDGIPDIVTVNFRRPHQTFSATFSVLAGNGDGTFRTAVTGTLPSEPTSLATADFAGDGHLSLVVGTVGGALVLLGNGDGTFQDSVLYQTGQGTRVSSVLVGDLTGTGRLDLVTAIITTKMVTVFRGNGDGTFGIANDYSVGGFGPRSVAVGRLRPGGPLDLVTADGSDSVSVLPGVGDGTFGQPSRYAAGSAPGAVAAADFTGGGVDDLVITNQSDAAGTVSVLLNQGDGTFPPHSTYPVGLDTSPSAFHLATGDFRGIGVQDLVTANQTDGTVTVFLGNGDGTFGAPHIFRAGFAPRRVVVGDFTGDGRLDLVVMEAGSSVVELLPGNGDGTFGAPIHNDAGPYA
jgi:hypothetical protein